MTLFELATAQIHKLPINIVVLNNHYLGMVRQWQELFYENRQRLPAPAMVRGPTHTLSVLVSNEPGVLMCICQVFSRRGFNIDSLVVSEGRNTNFSRMTIGISGDPEGLS